MNPDVSNVQDIVSMWNVCFELSRVCRTDVFMSQKGRV